MTAERQITFKRLNAGRYQVLAKNQPKGLILKIGQRWFNKTGSGFLRPTLTLRGAKHQADIWLNSKLPF